MRVSHYCYEADYHCPACAVKEFGANEYGLAHGIDREGNPISVVYDCDIKGGVIALTCGTCQELFEV